MAGHRRPTSGFAEALRFRSGFRRGSRLRECPAELLQAYQVLLTSASSPRPEPDAETLGGTPSLEWPSLRVAPAPDLGPAVPHLPTASQRAHPPDTRGLTAPMSGTVAEVPPKADHSRGSRKPPQGFSATSCNVLGESGAAPGVVGRVFHVFRKSKNIPHENQQTYNTCIFQVYSTFEDLVNIAGLAPGLSRQLLGVGRTYP